MNYEQYSELLLLVVITHNKKFKRDANFGYKSRNNFYDIEQIPNYDDDTSFDIDSSVDMIKKHFSQQLSRYLRMTKEWWYKMPTEERGSWVSTIMRS